MWRQRKKYPIIHEVMQVVVKYTELIHMHLYVLPF